jgi:hypothetical protein
MSNVRKAEKFIANEESMKTGKSKRRKSKSRAKIFLLSLFWPQIYGLTTKPTSRHFTKMKTILAFTASILLAGIFSCQGQDITNSTPETSPKTDAGLPAPSFDGDWQGSVKWVAGALTNLQFRLRIVINADSALVYERKKNKWAEIADEDTGSVKYTVSKMRDVCVVTWLNQYAGAVWTEEQTYSLSYINPDKIRVVQLRHVSNRAEGKNGTSWFYVCVGILTKTN